MPTIDVYAQVIAETFLLFFITFLLILQNHYPIITDRNRRMDTQVLLVRDGTRPMAALSGVVIMYC